MAKHMVKCPKCGKTFDTNTEQAVKVSARRYGHASCYPENTDFVPMEKKSQEQEELEDLKKYVSDLLKDKYSPARTNRQIKEYKEKYGYTYTGMKKALIWFYEIQNNSTEKSGGGIGIVPYVYQEAKDYYYNLFLAQKALADIEYKPDEQKQKEIIINSPRTRRRRKIRLFHFLEED